LRRVRDNDASTRLYSSRVLILFCVWNQKDSKEPNMTQTVNETAEAPAVAEAPVAEAAVVEAPAAVADAPQFIDADTMRAARETRAIGFGRITNTDNPRNILTVLRFEEHGGLKLVDTRKPERSVLHIVRSNDLEPVINFCVNMYVHEMIVDNPDHCPIVLAESLFVEQIEPVLVRRIGGHGGEKSNYSLIAGGRRTLSMALLYAMSRIAKAGIGADRFPAAVRKPAARLLLKLHGRDPVEPEIEGQISKANAREAYDLAVRENKTRKDFTDLEDAEIYENYLSQKNPETGEKFNLRSLAIYLGIDYQHLRGRHALNFLEDNEKEALARNPKRLTHYVQVALARKSGNPLPRGRSEEKVGKRTNALTAKEMQALFDATDRENIERMQAIADCMNIDFCDAIEASDDRIEKAKKSGGKRGRPKSKKTRAA